MIREVLPTSALGQNQPLSIQLGEWLLTGGDLNRSTQHISMVYSLKQGQTKTVVAKDLKKNKVNGRK